MKAEVIFEITPPVECTKEQFEEWIKYRLGIRDEIKLSNPLHEYDLDLSANGNNHCSISIHQVTMSTKIKSKKRSSHHFVRTLLAAVASNIKARYTAKKFDIWKECQDNN
ncbi:MAG: hypothetical protein N3E37_05065, partial [Candidatus Micrarchaeota archaeon]|nr:hypothetical protein [Candidatus Micrarchaeota archaeon]